MNPFETVDATDLRDGVGASLGDAEFRALSRHPLDSVDTEYPHASGPAEGPDDRVRPAERHPIFYGCFDWHSAVHSHWSLVRQLRLADDHPLADEITVNVDARLTRENAEREADYLADNPRFERPYGWGWLLRLAAELRRWDDARASAWRDALQPLETRVLEHVETHFLTRDRPIRVGTHGNSAFALHCVLDYARTVGNDALESAVAETARAFYADDADYPVRFEPLGWDFLSPALAEANLLRRVLEPADFAAWFDGFLPGFVAAAATDALPIAPETVAADESDGMALHLVGLNLSRAWALYDVADALAPAHDVTALRDAADAHARAGLDHAFTDEYAGSHWLSSFALHLLTRNADRNPDA